MTLNEQKKYCSAVYFTGCNYVCFPDWWVVGPNKDDSNETIGLFQYIYFQDFTLRALQKIYIGTPAESKYSRGRIFTSHF